MGPATHALSFPRFLSLFPLRLSPPLLFFSPALPSSSGRLDAELFLMPIFRRVQSKPLHSYRAFAIYNLDRFVWLREASSFCPLPRPASYRPSDSLSNTLQLAK